MIRERVALDTRRWRTPQQAVENTTALLLEQRKGPFEERINYTEIYLDPDGDLYHPSFGKIKNAIEVKTEIDRLELKAVEKLSEWARNNNCGQAIWISPPYPGQDESRFIVYDLKEEDGKKKIALHAICGRQSLEECLFIARQISAFSSSNLDANSEEALRQTPIPSNSQPSHPSWIDLLQELIGPPEIWQVIREENHIKAKENLLRTVQEEMQEFYPKVSSAQNLYQHLIIGAHIEERFAQLGYAIQTIGPCGISNTLALQRLSSEEGPFNIMFRQLPAIESSFPCPKCQKPIPSGRGITKCPHCGITKEEVGSKCD